MDGCRQWCAKHNNMPGYNCIRHTNWKEGADTVWKELKSKLTRLSAKHSVKWPTLQTKNSRPTRWKQKRSLFTNSLLIRVSFLFSTFVHLLFLLLLIYSRNWASPVICYVMFWAEPAVSLCHSNDVRNLDTELDSKIVSPKRDTHLHPSWESHALNRLSDQ